MTAARLAQVAELTSDELADRLALAQSVEHPLIVKQLRSISDWLETLDALPGLRRSPVARKVIEAADEAIVAILGCLDV